MRFLRAANSASRASSCVNASVQEAAINQGSLTVKLELPRATGEQKKQLAASSRWAQAAEVLVTDGLIATNDLKTFAGSNVLLLRKSTD